MELLSYVGRQLVIVAERPKMFQILRVDHTIFIIFLSPLIFL
jgi:hypothetical protein